MGHAESDSENGVIPEELLQADTVIRCMFGIWRKRRHVQALDLARSANGFSKCARARPTKTYALRVSSLAQGSERLYLALA